MFFASVKLLCPWFLPRGKIYLMPADLPALLERYARDFPEHAPGK